MLSPLADSKEKQFVVLLPCINVALRYSATFLRRCRTVTAVFSVNVAIFVSLARWDGKGWKCVTFLLFSCYLKDR